MALHRLVLIKLYFSGFDAVLCSKTMRILSRTVQESGCCIFLEFGMFYIFGFGPP